MTLSKTKRNLLDKKLIAADRDAIESAKFGKNDVNMYWRGFQHGLEEATRLIAGEEEHKKLIELRKALNESGHHP